MLSRQEKETVIVFNEEEPLATVSTFNSSIITRLSKLEGAVLMREYDEGEKRFTIPKNWIRFNPPRKLELSEEQRAERGRRLREARRV